MSKIKNLFNTPLKAIMTSVTGVVLAMMVVYLAYDIFADNRPHEEKERTKITYKQPQEKPQETSQELPQETPNKEVIAYKEVKQETKVNTTKENTDTITKEKALEIALNKAGVSRNDIFGLDIELDYERSVLVYEISFDTTNKEYDIEVNANDGSITKYEVENEDFD